jgi:hypothetical protein
MGARWTHDAFDRHRQAVRWIVASFGRGSSNRETVGPPPLAAASTTIPHNPKASTSHTPHATPPGRQHPSQPATAPYTGSAPANWWIRAQVCDSLGHGEAVGNGSGSIGYLMSTRGRAT